jgi:formylglycine-generating enzyme required for sulfatase activity
VKLFSVNPTSRVFPLIEFFLALCLLAGSHPAAAQDTRFFRIAGPAATKLAAFRSDGSLVWSNALTGTNYTVQTTTALPAGTNWVDYLQLPTTNKLNTNQIIAFNPPAGMTFIPAGLFTMGDTLDGESDARPTNVILSAFFMDVNLVRYDQWQTVFDWATNYGYSFVNSGSAKAANHPVVFIDWYDTLKWCNARSQLAGLAPVYFTDTNLTQVYTNGETTNVFANWMAAGFRLPTEAEWEKAARGGLSGLRFPWGNTISTTQANYVGNSGTYSYDLGPDGSNPAFTNGVSPYTSPVGYFAPNGYGLYDMAGNVFEWCWDWYGTAYAGGSDPRGSATGSLRVLRSGSWVYGAVYPRCANRNNNNLTITHSGLGFRCVKGQ